MTAQFGPCAPFVSLEDLLASPCCALLGTPDGIPCPEDALDMATEILWILSGRTLTGPCEKTVRPCGYCGCCFPCGCLPPAIELDWPVQSITEILIDGEIVNPSTYTVIDDRWLVRLDATNGRNEGWPSWQNLAVPTTERDTYQITYVSGQPVPLTAKAAVLELGCELVREQLGLPCAFSPGTTGVSRQGVSVSMDRTVEDSVETASTLSSVARFVSLYNPGNERLPPGIWSPDEQPADYTF